MASGPSSQQPPVTQESERDRVTQDCLRALERLSGDAHNLQKLLSFLDARAVEETVLTGATAANVPREFKFLFNKKKLALRVKLWVTGLTSYT